MNLQTPESVTKNEVGPVSSPPSFCDAFRIDDKITPIKNAGSSKSFRDDCNDHYDTIGNTLMICEAGSVKVGIPVRFPTKKQRMLRSELDLSVEEFVRVNLVSVRTELLELYIEDLTQVREQADSLKTLGIDSPTAFERYSWVFLFGIITLSPLLLPLFIWEVKLPFAPFFIVLITCLFGLAASYLSSEKERRMSFATIIQSEILRRQGISNNPTARLTPTSA